MKMYTIDGQAVELVKKIHEGYLAKVVYKGILDEEGDEEFEYGEVLDDRISFFKALYEKPMTEAFAKEVKELKAEAVSLANEISDLKEQKRSESGLLNKIAKFPFVQKLVDYLTEDYEFILDLKDYQVTTKGRHYRTPYVAAVNVKMENGWGIYEIRSDYYVSNDDRKFMPFKTMEELSAFAKQRIIAAIKKMDNNYNKSNNLRDWFKKIHDSCPMKIDAEVVSAYNAQMDAFLKEEGIERAEKLKKEVLELEKKKQELEKLTA